MGAVLWGGPRISGKAELFRHKDRWLGDGLQIQHGALRLDPVRWVSSGRPPIDNPAFVAVDDADECLEGLEPVAFKCTAMSEHILSRL
jgi:hypothetical protein